MKRMIFLMTATAMMAVTSACTSTGNGRFIIGGSSNGELVTASDHYVTDVKQVEEFDELAVAGNFDVEYTQDGDKPTVEIYTADNILPVLDIKVKEGTLHIGIKEGYRVNGKKIRVRTNSARLKKVSSAGSGMVTLANGMKTETLEMSVAGSGDIGGAEISCDNLVLAIAGSGNIYMQSIAATTIKTAIAGSGDMDLADIDCNRLETSIAGSGTVRLSGKTKSAEFGIFGSGNIDARELKAETIDSDVAGSGRISVKK